MTNVKMIFPNSTDRDIAFSVLYTHYYDNDDVYIDKSADDDVRLDVVIYYDDTVDIIMKDVHEVLNDNDYVAVPLKKYEESRIQGMPIIGHVTLDEDDDNDERPALIPHIEEAVCRWFSIVDIPLSFSKRIVGLLADMHIRWESDYDIVTDTCSIDIYCTRNDLSTINRWIDSNF